jgi:hypothetical protein
MSMHVSVSSCACTNMHAAEEWMGWHVSQFAARVYVLVCVFTLDISPTYIVSPLLASPPFTHSPAHNHTYAPWSHKHTLSSNLTLTMTLTYTLT